MNTLRHLIDTQATRQADRPFLISPESDQTLSYAALHHLARDTAARLAALGLGKDDKVAFLLDNGYWPTVLFLSAMYGGFVIVPLNAAAGVEQLAYVLAHSDSKVLFISPPYQRRLAETLASMPVQVLVTDVDAGPPHSFLSLPATSTPYPLAPEDTALLIYTSGTTGTPKGVLLSHANVIAGGRNTVLAHGLDQRDRALCVLPLYHINAEMVTVMAPLVSGGSVVMPHGFDVTRFWHWLAEYACTWFSVVPTLISALLETDASPRVRFGRSASAPLAPAVHQAFEQRFGVRIVETMGLTETAAQILANPPPPAAGKYGSPGIPYGNEAKIVDGEGCELPGGEIGEIVIRGPNVMQGYYKDPAATRAALEPDGWLHSGDLARRDADGFFFITGRLKELIIRGGENIAPREIDDVLYRHPAVREAAAFAVEDSHYGQEVAAAVVLKTGAEADESELLAFGRTQLGHTKAPKFIRILETLPKGPSGKIQRLKLSDRYGSPSPRAHDKETPENLLVNPLCSPDEAQRNPGLPPGFRCASSGLQDDALETLLLEAWQSVLDNPALDIHSNFFACGGTSVQGAVLLNRLSARFGIDLHLLDLFEAPDVAGFAAFLWSRYPDLRLDATEAQTEHPEFHNGLLPVSSAQQRLWLLLQLEPDSNVAYNIPVHLHWSSPDEAQRNPGLKNPGFRCASSGLHPDSNPAILAQALSRLVQRHPSLRTAFRERDGVPWQVIEARLDVILPVENLTAAELPARIRAEALTPFDVTRHPLWRACLLHLDNQQHILLFTAHHLIFDGWSAKLLVQELTETYSALTASSPLEKGGQGGFSKTAGPLLTNPPQPPFCKGGGDWWRDYLAGAPPLLELPTDHPRPPAQTFHGASVPLHLSPPLSAKLRAVSRTTEVTPFMTLLAAFGALLARYSGQTDVVVGVPVRQTAQPVIGFLVNNLAVRLDLSGNADFSTLLTRVKHSVLAAYAHQDTPFEQVLDAVQPERDLRYTPLFQVAFMYQPGVPNFASETKQALSLPLLPRESFTAKYDLTLWLEENTPDFYGYVEYNRDLFNPDTIQGFTRHFENLLSAAVQDPHRSVATLPLLEVHERRQLLVEWNETRADYPALCLPQWFEEQAVVDKIAVIHQRKTLTYRQLNARANQIAHYLRRQGVGPEVAVGVCLNRHPDLVAALLGVLKAGGFYVPLDPAYPPERLAFMLEDAAIGIVLTESALQNCLQTRVIPVDSDAALAACPTDNPPPLAGPDNLAYVIYTSGSTGQPKGVQIPHRAVTNFLYAMQRTPGFSRYDRCLAVTTVAFDIAVLELFLPLVSGGQTVLVDRDTAADGYALVAALQTAKATVMQATPATWRLLLAAGWQGDLKVLCGGEALDAELAAQLSTRATQVWNLYGPTETTVWSACQAVSPRGEDLPRHAGHHIPIGRPIANTRIYILDSHLQPVPIGVRGELYIGGDGLARGYLNRPELTAARFSEVSLPPGGLQRLYKTGDLACWRPDGVLECLGRTDNQVKLRGFRIELGEIEAVLATHPAVQQCAVVMRESRLLAYYTARVPSLPRATMPRHETPSAVTSEELRTFLSQKLPAYMLPGAFIPLPALPMTPNGKIHRRALPAPPREMPSDNRPRTPVEQRLAQLWAEVLSATEIGIHSDFFAIGGHSLAALQLLKRMESEFGVKLPLRTLFEHPTVAALAQVLHTPAEVGKLPELVPLATRTNGPPLFCIHPIGGQVLCYRPLAQRLNRPCYGLQATDKAASVAALAARYLAALRSVQPQGPYYLCGWSFGGIVAFEMARQLVAGGESVALLALIDSRLPDPQAAPLSAAALRQRFVAELARDTRPSTDAIPHHLFEIFQANHAAWRAYQPAFYPGGIHGFYPPARREVAQTWVTWCEDFVLHPLNGDHYSLLQAPAVDAIATVLSACMRS